VTIGEDDIDKDVVFDRIFDVEDVSVNVDVTLPIVDDITIGEDDIDKDIVFDVVTKLLVVVVETDIAVATDVEPPIVTGSIVDADDNIAVEDCGKVLVVVILARKFN